jgi:hypothetical protein
MTYIYILALLLHVGIFIFFVRRSLAKKASKKVVSTAVGGASTYEQTRNTALSITPDQLGLNIPQGALKVYGVVMDWDMSGTILTLTAYINGAANAVLSSGAAVVGGGKNPAVAEEASEFVLVAQNYISKTLHVTTAGLPAPGTVRFNFLTNQGVYAAQELLSAINDNSSPWMGLFFRGSMLLDEIKKTAA